MSDSVESVLREGLVVSSYWGKRILRAERVGGFTPLDRLYAAEWVTCACGHVDPSLLRGKTGIPRNWLLRILGRDFEEHVNGNKYMEAARCLDQIQKVSKELLRNE